MLNERIVLYSGKRVNKYSPVSALAILETLLASFVGMYITWSGEYWIFWTSLFLTFLVHLRSEKSVEEGIRLFDGSWTRITNNYPSRRIAVISLTSAIVVALVWIFLLAPLIFDKFGWIGSYGSLAMVGFISLNLLVAAAVFAILVSLLLSNETKKKTSSDSAPPSAPSKRTLTILLIIGTALLPGAVAAFTLCLIVIRTTATIKNLRDGLANFLQNWSTLMLRTDLTSEPEVLPGLPEDHALSFRSFISEISAPGIDFSEKYGILLSSGIFFPSIFYRLLLKTSFWIYAPLIWIASPPRGLERDINGILRWDPLLARTPVDIVAAFVAFVGVFFLVFRVWDYSAYQAAATWAEANDFPAYWPLLAAGLNAQRLDLWYLLPGVGALLSLAIFVWAMQISAHVKLTGRFPGQFELWCLYKINSVKNILSLATVALGIAFLLYYYSAKCQLPTLILNTISMFGGTACALQ